MSQDKENQMIEEPAVDAGQQQAAASDFGGYDELVTLTPREHIRLRPGMYIGKLGDGSQNDDGIYVLIKEVIDNSIDEFNTGYAKPTIDIDVVDGAVTIRDYGRGIPLDQIKAASSKMNTGAKYDTQTYKRSVGLNGVGIKAVNALSTEFYIRSVRDGQCSSVSPRRKAALSPPMRARRTARWCDSSPMAASSRTMSSARTSSSR